MKNHKSVWQLLLSSPNINMNLLDGHDNTAIHWGAMYNRKEAVEMLLARPEAKVNGRNRRNMSPVMLAVSLGRKDVLGVLLEEKKVDLWVTDGKGVALEKLAGGGRNGEWGVKETQEITQMVEAEKEKREKSYGRDVSVEVESTIALVKQLLIQKIFDLENRRRVQQMRERDEEEKTLERKKGVAGVQNVPSIDGTDTVEEGVGIITSSVPEKEVVTVEKGVEVLTKELETLREGSVVKKVQSLLTCGGCGGKVGVPAWQCGAGHIQCGACKEEINCCPTCDGIVVGRALVLEAIPTAFKN